MPSQARPRYLEPALLQPRVDLPQDLPDLFALAGEVLVLVLGADLPRTVPRAALLVGADIGLVDLDLDLALDLVDIVDALDQQLTQAFVGQALGDLPGLVVLTVSGPERMGMGRALWRC